MITNPDPAILAKTIHARYSTFIIIVAKNLRGGVVNTGSGFVIKKSGDKCVIITCRHVLEGDDGFCRNRDRIFLRRMCDTRGRRVQQFAGDLVFSDESTDLAFIEVSGVTAKVDALTFAPATKVPIGTTTIAIGYCTPDAWECQPLAFVRTPAVSPGVIKLSGVQPIPHSLGKGLEVNLSCIAMSGMSGGPAICSYRVIGVITGGDHEQGTTYAVCTETVEKVIRRWLAHS